MSAPDTSQLTSSAQIFASNHTLPQIKSIHKTLHVQIEDKATRLRTQVGGSYRELLGTAETIVRMRHDNDEVQDVLGRMGGRCGRAVVGAKASGLAAFVTREQRREAVEAARLELLDRCALMVARVLQAGTGLPDGVSRGDRLVLATKMFVLSRLLIKHLDGDAKSAEARAAIDSARKTVAMLRRKLQRGMEKVLQSNEEGENNEDVLKALCAYSLATNAGAKDVLRRFLDVRAEAMTFTLDGQGDHGSDTDGVVNGMRLYTRTLLDVQSLVPSKLSQALAGLKKEPLIEDSMLKRLEGLRLDVAQRWCGDDIEYFTPFIRHDDLDGKQARELLADWAKKGGQVLLTGLKKALGHMSDFKSIMELRTTVLQLWIRDGGRARGFDPLEMQDDLRDAINTRMLAVLDTKVKKLHLVGSEIKATLDNWSDGADKQLDLWDEAGYDTALKGGVAPFMKEVTSRLYGRNDAVSRAVTSYTSWFHVVDDVKGVVESLRKQRWDNDYEEIEDEETIDARQQLLSREDPQRLQAKLDSSLDTVFKELEYNLSRMWEAKSSNPSAGSIATYLLRILRDVHSELPDRPSVSNFGLSMVTPLHNSLAKQVVEDVLDDFNTYLASRAMLTLPLWEGEPPLPTQPSPELYQFLRSLSLAMSSIGTDLWSPRAVAVLKGSLGELLCDAWDEELKKLTEDGKEGEGEEGSTEKDRLATQWLFDVELLQACLGESASDRPSNLGNELFKLSKLRSDAARQTIGTASKETWKRTSLLFGLLA